MALCVLAGFGRDQHPGASASRAPTVGAQLETFPALVLATITVRYANHVPHAQHRGLVIAADLCLDLALGVILHERVVSLAK
ncbi:hypothetical protein D3C72_1976850 [compost metagenome]